MQSSHLQPVPRPSDGTTKDVEQCGDEKKKQRTHWQKITVYADEPEEVIELLKTYKGTGHIDKWKVEQSTRYYKYGNI